MDEYDIFGAYTPETRGDLETYLRTYDSSQADNLFRGPEYFHIIKNKGYIVPFATSVRVNMSPAPDTVYFVTDEGQLASNGVGHMNMNAIGAPEGIYDPDDALKDVLWSINMLNPEILFKSEEK